MAKSPTTQFRKPGAGPIAVLIAALCIPGALGEIDVTAPPYNAVPDDGRDDAPAFQAAFEDAVAAGAAVIRIPPGAYDLFSRVELYASTADLQIRGAGIGVTRLRSHNPEGILKMVFAQRSPIIAMRDFSFFAPRREAGVGIELYCPPGGNKQHHTFTARNIEFRSEDIAHDYYRGAFRLTGFWRPVFHSVVFGGPYGPPQEEEFMAHIGVELIDCPAPSFRHSYFWDLKTGVRLVGTSCRELEFLNSVAVECRNGIVFVPGDRHHSGARFSCSHINCEDSGIVLRNHYGFTIENCLMYHKHTGYNPEYIDIRLEDCFDGTIARTIFHQGNNFTRQMISGDANCRDIVLAGNIYNADGIPLEVRSGAHLLAVDSVDPPGTSNPGVTQRGAAQLRAWAIGDGTIDQSPDGTEFPAGTVVSLTAVPATGRRFLYWETPGGYSNDTTQINRTLDDDLTIFAVFEVDENRFTGWRDRWLPEYTNLNARMDDADADGHVNFAEYALGSDPSRAEKIPDARLHFARDDGALNLRLRRARERKDVRYGLQVSSDFSDWISPGQAASIEPIDDEHEWAIWGADTNNRVRLFRARITPTE
ncbi:InlB B-repeat-containing protein [Kiritimatiella glycovorans]|uniref:InlB B-repeat-containing protein n=1 Tax=Kiritimatiella glycovorans TaxID=1307763 RepID=UPI00069A593C|nr:hypothetical protein [Kiritimatiella glycovorans]